MKESILDMLEAANIVSIDLNPDSTVNVMEECDNFFEQNLDKAEMGQLIKELQELHGRMG